MKIMREKNDQYGKQIKYIGNYSWKKRKRINNKEALIKESQGKKVLFKKKNEKHFLSL